MTPRARARVTRTAHTFSVNDGRVIALSAGVLHWRCSLSSASTGLRLTSPRRCSRIVRGRLRLLPQKCAGVDVERLREPSQNRQGWTLAFPALEHRKVCLSDLGSLRQLFL